MICPHPRRQNGSGCYKSGRRRICAPRFIRQHVATVVETDIRGMPSARFRSNFRHGCGMLPADVSHTPTPAGNHARATPMWYRTRVGQSPNTAAVTGRKRR